MIEMSLYRPIFRRAYDFMSRHADVLKSGDFDSIVADIQQVSDPFELKLFFAVANELDRRYSEDNAQQISLI